MRLFTFDTKYLVLTQHASSGSHMGYFRWSKVNNYNTTLHNIN